MISKTKVVTMINASNACKPACVTGPNGFKNWGPKATSDKGISIRKTEVIAREMWDRTRSQVGLESELGGEHVGERKL